MRLIDGKLLADVILGEIYKHGQESGNYDDYLEIGALTHNDIAYLDGYDKALDDVYRQISDMKTVKAIPIEFIEKQINKSMDINNKDELDILYAGNLSYLIKLWKGYE